MKDELLQQIGKSIEVGDVSQVQNLVQTALNNGFSAEEILSDGLLVGMNVVGVRFRDGLIFIPEVLVAARAMQSGVDILEPHFSVESVSSRKKFLIGTVKDDLHDLGKNIVSIIFRGSGFEVYDLGINVSEEKFVEEAKKFQPDVIGISALLTTTMINMKNTVKALKSNGIDSLIIVGGAPITEDFAKEIGADLFGKNAMDGLEKVKEALSLN